MAGTVSRKMARKILRDGEVRGKPLSGRQRRFFGARISGAPVKKKRGKG